MPHRSPPAGAPAPAPSRYHHGALREALIAAGLDALEREGFEALKLRSIAAQAGVSHAAPAHHFGTLTGLRTALAATGYRMLGDAMATAAASGAGTAMEHMRHVGTAYQTFALGHPNLYGLMHARKLLDWENEDLRRNAARTTSFLVDICRPVADALQLGEEGRRALEHLTWATAHGMVSLAIGGQLGPPPYLVPNGENGCPTFSDLLFHFVGSAPSAPTKSSER